MTTNANNLEEVNTSCILIVHLTLIQLMAVNTPANKHNGQHKISGTCLHTKKYNRKLPIGHQ